MQSNQEMIECAIFGEFFENENDTLGGHFTSSYLFFSHSQNYFKKLHINTIMICTYRKKIKFFEALLSIPIMAFQFHYIQSILPNQISSLV